MLEVCNVDAGYFDTQVLFGMLLSINRGELVTLLGRNGMGKTTTLRAVMGLLPISNGEIRLFGRPIVGLPPFRIARAGIGLVPEGRMVCANLTVRENLLVTARPRSADRKAWTLDGVYRLFPLLKARQSHFGDQLSGGEQQLVAIGRALLTNPDILIMDEATEGLAPLMREEVWRFVRTMREQGQSMLIIDKHVDVLSRIADRHYVIEKGCVVWQGNGAELAAQRRSLGSVLGI
jgi:branched-chain amino acid transport system ATP-binding protein